MRKSNYFDVVVEGAEYPNFGTATYKDRKVKFKGAIIGQKVSLMAQRKRQDSIKAKLLEVLEPSPLETEEGCPQTGICGGCTYQKLTYDSELAYKKDLMKKLYSPLGLDLEKLVINPSPNLAFYRNKMEYTFGDEYKDGPITLGLHRKNRFYEIVNTVGCNIVNPDYEAIRLATMEFFHDKGFKAYHKKKEEGALKFFIIRHAFDTNEIMVNLVSKEDPSITKDLLLELKDHLLKLDLGGKIVSFYHTISNSTADAVKPDEIRHIYGQEYINERINGLSFRISPFSFFQPNPLGAENLYNKALEFAGDIDNKVVYDLYCGTGTISQIFAKKAKKVIGVEIVEEAVEKARENAKINNLNNTDFRANDVLLEIENLTDKPDVLVLDPPREGIHPKAIDHILNMKADTVVYISCNPKTHVRDLGEFQEAGYEIKKLEIFDQFPRTTHVESVALLSKLDVNQHIKVKLDMDELDITASESKATYEEIKDYVLKKNDMKVSNLYISQIKRKCGLEVGKNYNVSKKENPIVPNCPPEKEEAIREALEHFKMI